MAPRPPRRSRMPTDCFSSRESRPQWLAVIVPQCPDGPARRWISLFATSAVRAGVMITELMASNKTTLATAQGLYEDWIELHNDSDSAVDLAGWYLTDDPADLRKWRFPSTAATSPVPGGGHLIVFADDSLDGVVSGELHANFKLSAGGEYLALVEPDGETVA